MSCQPKKSQNLDEFNEYSQDSKFSNIRVSKLEIFQFSRFVNFRVSKLEIVQFSSFETRNLSIFEFQENKTK